MCLQGVPKYYPVYYELPAFTLSHWPGRTDHHSHSLGEEKERGKSERQAAAEGEESTDSLGSTS